jgi:hypothetical protein
MKFSGYSGPSGLFPLQSALAFINSFSTYMMNSFILSLGISYTHQVVGQRKHQSYGKIKRKYTVFIPRMAKNARKDINKMG